MAAGEGDVPDWRDAAAYAPLLRADRSFIAWEWLRRTPGYRAAAERAFSAGSGDLRAWPAERPERWGLHRFELPGVSVPEARPVWCADLHLWVLGIEARPGGLERFELERLPAGSVLVTSAGGREHLLISNGLHAIRLDVLGGTLAGGPVQLRYLLSGFESAERPLLTLRRFLALWRTGAFCRSLHAPEARARRWVLMLRAQDGLDAGADQREIAAALLSAEAGEPLWRSRSPSLRSRVQRLVRGARRMASGGYLELLR
jgi:hypothetical protein